MQQAKPGDDPQPSYIPAGWIGGFPSNEPYPKSKLLESLPFPGNMDNIKSTDRMLRAKWPEFSWEVTKGDPSTRMYQMFAPDISRLGYDNKGQVWSIICPQQGIYFPDFGLTLNIEVTVKGTRGWIDEEAPKNELFASDLIIQPTIWFSTDSKESTTWKILQDFNSVCDDLLPLIKAKGIALNSTNVGSTDPIIQVRMGEYPDYPFPERAKHWVDYAWAVAHLGVTIGSIKPTEHLLVDTFNQVVLDLFNLGSGNLLQENNILIWNLWAGSPELVNQDEWFHHATYWRHSIDVNHRPPEGVGTTIADFDGKPFEIDLAYLGNKMREFLRWISLQLG